MEDRKTALLYLRMRSTLRFCFSFSRRRAAFSRIVTYRALPSRTGSRWLPSLPSLKLCSCFEFLASVFPFTCQFGNRRLRFGTEVGLVGRVPHGAQHQHPKVQDHLTTLVFPPHPRSLQPFGEHRFAGRLRHAAADRHSLTPIPRILHPHRVLA